MSVTQDLQNKAPEQISKESFGRYVSEVWSCLLSSHMEFNATATCAKRQES